MLGTLLFVFRFFGMSFIASIGDSQITKTEVEGSLVDSQGTFWKDAWLVLHTLPAGWKSLDDCHLEVLDLQQAKCQDSLSHV